MSSSKRRARRYSASSTNSGKGNFKSSGTPSAPSTVRERGRGRTSSGIISLNHDSDSWSEDYGSRRRRPAHVQDIFLTPDPTDRASSGSSSTTTEHRLFSPDHGSNSSSDTEIDEDILSNYPSLRLRASAVGLGQSDSQDTIRQPNSRRDSASVFSTARPLTYSSLPPTPICASPPPTAPFSPGGSSSFIVSQPPFSLWDYLQEELLATDFDSHQEMKWERVSNFLNVPVAVEKIIGFGFILCLDSFLYTFTILPIRSALAFWRLCCNTFKWQQAPTLPPAQKADLLRMLLLIVSTVILAPLTDASKIYHSIRGQDTIKLYVIFNALEIADRLCASIGQDILDCLFSRSTLAYLSHRKPVCSQTARPFLFFILGVVYTVAHTLVMVYQTIALNVAVNSYDHALLTLLMSNQFVEIKGSVFKKFEKDNLFQITCADIVERFTLSLMLVVVAFRNLIELSGSEFNFSEGFSLPKSFGWFRGNNVLWTISYPVIAVIFSEMVVDWLKHAFITKFNHIRPSVYERYTDVLCRDLASGSAVGRRGARKHTYVDQSPLVARRLGFASLPLAVLAILIGSQSLSLLFSIHFESEDSSLAVVSSERVIMWLKWGTLGVAFWSCFVAIKIIMGVRLLSYATTRKAGMQEREDEDVINDFGRDPVGEGKDERIYNRELKTYLDNNDDNAEAVAEIGERTPVAEDNDNEKSRVKDAGGGGKKRLALEDITRFTMVKRIW